MGNFSNFSTLFDEIKRDEEVHFPTYSNEDGHIILGGITRECVFTIIADVQKSASLCVSGENTELIMPGLQQLVTDVVGTEPLCQYDVHTDSSELHVIEWNIGVIDLVYLVDLVSAGGRYFRGYPKENLVLFNGHDPQEYYSAEYLAGLQAEHQQEYYENPTEDATPDTSQPNADELDLSLAKFAAYR